MPRKSHFYGRSSPYLAGLLCCLLAAAAAGLSSPSSCSTPSSLGWCLVHNWGKMEVLENGMYGHFNPKCPIFISLLNTCNCPIQVDEQSHGWIRQSKSGFLRQLLNEHLFCSFSSMELNLLDLATPVRFSLGNSLYLFLFMVHTGIYR